MSTLEIWLLVVVAFLWVSGGTIIYETGAAAGKCGPGKSPKWLVVSLWPFAALFVMFGG